MPRRRRWLGLYGCARVAALGLLVASIALAAMSRGGEARAFGRVVAEEDSRAAGAPTDRPDDRALETRVLELLNGERATRGLLPLTRVSELDTAARANTERMARSGEVHHSPPGDLQRVPVRWRALGENVGAASTVEEIHRLMMGSSVHRANVLRSAFDAIGIAVAYGDDRRYYVTEVFASQTR